MMIPPEVYVPRSWHFRPVGGKIGGSIGSRMIEESNREAAGMILLKKNMNTIAIYPV